MALSIDELGLLLLRDPLRATVLQAVKDIELTQAFVAAGFVRNAAWDYLHGYTSSSNLVDVDVVYFNPEDPQPERDHDIERLLRERLPGIPWSVKNQARMHIRNNERPYQSTLDAISKWPESATCVAARLNVSGQVHVEAPWGIDDLVNLKVRMSPGFHRDPLIYEDRIRSKNWKETWPLLDIEHMLTDAEYQRRKSSAA